MGAGASLSQEGQEQNATKIKEAFDKYGAPSDSNITFKEEVAKVATEAKHNDMNIDTLIEGMNSEDFSQLENWMRPKKAVSTVDSTERKSKEQEATENIPLNDLPTAVTDAAVVELPSTSEPVVAVPVVDEPVGAAVVGETIIAVVEPTAVEALPIPISTESPESKAEFKYGNFYINNIACFDLRNTEFLGLTKQDPYIEVSCGTNWTDQTSVQEEAGSFCSWDFLDMKYNFPSLKKFQSHSEPFQFVVKDKNTGQDCVIGVGSMVLHEKEVSLNQEVIYTVELAVPGGAEAAGRLEVTGVLRNDQRTYTEAQLLALVHTRFQGGNLTIDTVQVDKLKNTETSGMQDPYLKVSIGELLNKTSTAKGNAGDNAIWQNLRWKCLISKEQVCGLSLVVEAWDQNTLADVKIGCGESSLLRCAAFVGDIITLSITLKGAGGEPAGLVALKVRIREGECTSLANSPKPKATNTISTSTT